ncbi:MAG: TetR/AcrR family transcriptional regulator, partial [Arachnia propionica]|nr:TetR/AcrR family transcriptional regulator [Arachnia propionica]
MISDKVRPAVLAAIEAKGYAGVTYEGVAAASGVAKTTLYRHWPTKAELVFDLVVHGHDVHPLDCDPTVEGASQALAARVARFLGAGPAARAVPAVLLDMTNDPVLAERLRTGVVAQGQVEVAQLLDRCGLDPIQGMDAGDVQMVLL